MKYIDHLYEFIEDLFFFPFILSCVVVIYPKQIPHSDFVHKII